jgi:hypothetical protein
MVRGAKALSRALYLPRRIERAAQIARRNNYPFLQPKHLELLVKMNMASRAKHEWSALQIAFTAPKFSATAGDALKLRHGSMVAATSNEGRWLSAVGHGQSIQPAVVLFERNREPTDPLDPTILLRQPTGSHVYV